MLERRWAASFLADALGLKTDPISTRDRAGSDILNNALQKRLRRSMEEDIKPNINLVVGQAIGEIRALHRRLDTLEREISSVTQKLESRPSRSERYLLIFMMLLLALLIGSGIVIYRIWASGRPIF